MLKLNVLYLKKTNLATEEDKKNNPVCWAELFKATTWEDQDKIDKMSTTIEHLKKLLAEVGIKETE